MKSFRIQNIKAFADSGDVQLAPITIFVGKNSCGKSSLVRFPAVLAQTALENSNSPISFFGKLLDYGNYEDVVHGHFSQDIKYTIEYEVDINHLSPTIVQFDRFSYRQKGSDAENMRNCKYSVTIGKKGKRLTIKSIELMLDNAPMYSAVFTDEKCRYSLYVLVADNNELVRLNEEYVFYDCGKRRFRYAPNLVHVNVPTERIAKAVDQQFGEKGGEKTIKYLGFDRFKYHENIPDNLNEADKTAIQIERTITFLEDITGNIERLLQEEASRLSYIGPFRQDPERYYRNIERNTTIVGVRGENVSTMLINDFYNNNVLIESISTWMHDTLGYKLAIKDMGSNLFQVMLEDDKGFQSNIMDVGYGVSQILPIVVAVFQDYRANIRRYRGCDNILIIEQPELHLHPAAQTELANLFANCVLHNNKRLQRKLLIETHSEHLIRKIQVLVAEKTLSSEMVKIYYVDKNDDGNASISEMKILPNGKFEERWPSGFFDKAQELTMDLLRASAKKIGDI